MGLTQKLGTIPLAIQTDSSNNVGIGGAANASYKLAVTGASAFWDGTQGLNIRAYTGGSGFGAIYSTGVTAGAGNFALAASPTQTILSGVDSVGLAINSGIKLNINSSGQILIGSNANSADTSLLTIKQSSTAYNNGIYLERGGERNGYFMYIGGALDALTFRRNYFGTQSDVMSLTRDGNVGIGTSSPSTKLHVYGTATVFDGLLLENSNSNAYTVYQAKTGNSSKWQWGVWNDNSYRIGISGVADFLQIGSGGEVRAIGQGSSSTAFSIYDGSSRRVFCIPSQYYGYIFAVSVASDGGKAISIGNGGGAAEVGSIVANNASTTYNTTSDYRLKEDFKDFNGLEKISNIKVYDFKWKTNDERTHGVIAHELAEVLPYAVHGQKDGLDRDGKPSYQGVDYSKIVPSLVKAIQELSAKVTALENKS